jgi:hypothetical protein
MRKAHKRLDDILEWYVHRQSWYISYNSIDHHDNLLIDKFWTGLLRHLEQVK